MQDQEILDPIYLSTLKKRLMITSGFILLGVVLVGITAVLEESGVWELSSDHVGKTGWVKLNITLATGMFLIGVNGLVHIFLLAKLAWRAKTAEIFANSVDQIPFLFFNSWMSKNANWWMMRLLFPALGIFMFSIFGFVGLLSMLAFLFNW